MWAGNSNPVTLTLLPRSTLNTAARCSTSTRAPRSLGYLYGTLAFGQITGKSPKIELTNNPKDMEAFGRIVEITGQNDISATGNPSSNVKGMLGIIGIKIYEPAASGSSNGCADIVDTILRCYLSYVAGRDQLCNSDKPGMPGAENVFAVSSSTSTQSFPDVGKPGGVKA